MTTILSDERQYPPKTFNTSSEPENIIFLNQTVYYEKINLDNANINYGSGNYEIYSSSEYLGQKKNVFLIVF
jgi:hypothetical protein